MLYCCYLSVDILIRSNMCRLLLCVMSDSKSDSSNQFCIWKRHFFLKKRKFGPFFCATSACFIAGRKNYSFQCRFSDFFKNIAPCSLSYDFRIWSRNLKRTSTAKVMTWSQLVIHSQSSCIDEDVAEVTRTTK